MRGELGLIAQQSALSDEKCGEKLRFLILTSDMSEYRGAFYQIDFLDELAKQVDCVFYGPKYPGFSPENAARQVRNLVSNGVSAILLAHSFLSDNPKKKLAWLEPIELAGIDLPKYAIINKEYSRLNEKLDYFQTANVRQLYSHHHNLASLAPSFSIEAIFLPLAVNSERFFESKAEKIFDLGFTGLLRNPTFPQSQVSTRVEIQNEIFHTWNGIPIKKKLAYQQLNVRWHTWTGKLVRDRVLSALPHRRRLSAEEYSKLLRMTKVWLNAPSPLDIISTRYFECMASGAVVLAQESSALSQLFPSGMIATYSNVHGFRQTLQHLLHDNIERENIAETATRFIKENHTWSHRIRQFLSSLDSTERD